MMAFGIGQLYHKAMIFNLLVAFELVAPICNFIMEAKGLGYAHLIITFCCDRFVACSSDSIRVH